MKKRLDEFTVDQFIDMICEGDISAESDHESAKRDLVFEYHTIADPVGALRYLSLMEELQKCRLSVAVYTMCVNLTALKEHGLVRQVLIECGFDPKTMNDQRIEAEVLSRLERSKRRIQELENEMPEDIGDKRDIRCGFDKQTAAMMAFFKFHIDTSCMKASVYAHLVARHNREVKERLAAMRNK